MYVLLTLIMPGALKTILCLIFNDVDNIVHVFISKDISLSNERPTVVAFYSRKSAIPSELGQVGGVQVSPTVHHV